MQLSADLREVWKRLGIKGVIMHTYGTDGSIDNPKSERFWAQHIDQVRPFLGLWYPSAMQGCKL